MNIDTSMFLHAGIQNALYRLEPVIPAYAEGKLTEPHHPHAIGVLFRQLGACRLLTTGVAEPLFIAQMQSVSAYLHRLPHMPDDHKVTSRAGVLWDAIGGEYWEAASEIARHSRTTVNPTWEHEDDFLFVWFVINRYLHDVTPADDLEGRTQSEQRQRNLLDRWKLVLEGGSDPRHTLCDALLRGDAADFRAAFEEVADAREAQVRQQLQDGQLPQEDAVWSLPLWFEGLALLRLAERDGLQADTHCRGVPNITRVPNPFAYDSKAWQKLDFTPGPRA